MTETTMVRVDKELLDEVTETFPEIQDMAEASKVRWALRYLLKLKQAYMEK